MNALRLLRAMNVVWGYVIKIKWNIVFIVCDSLKIANVHHSVNFHLGRLRAFFLFDIALATLIWTQLYIVVCLCLLSATTAVGSFCSLSNVYDFWSLYIHSVIEHVWNLFAQDMIYWTFLRSSEFLFYQKKLFLVPIWEKLHFSWKLVKKWNIWKEKTHTCMRGVTEWKCEIIGWVLVYEILCGAQTYFSFLLFSFFLLLNNRRRQ